MLWIIGIIIVWSLFSYIFRYIGHSELTNYVKSMEYRIAELEEELEEKHKLDKKAGIGVLSGRKYY